MQVQCGGESHEIKFFPNGQVQFLNHRAHLDQLIEETEVIEAGDGKISMGCGWYAKRIRARNHVKTNAPDPWLDRVQIVQYKREFRTKRSKDVVLEDLIKPLLEKVWNASNIPHFRMRENTRRDVIVNYRAGQLGDIRVLRQDLLEIYVEKKAWAHLYAKGLHTVQLPPGVSYGLESTIALGQKSPKKGQPVLNIVTFRENVAGFGREKGIQIPVMRLASVHHVRGAWHFKDWIA